MPPTKTRLLAELRRMSTLLEIDGANSFKVNAYVRALRALGDESIDLGLCVEQDSLTDIDGIGKGIAEKITEFWREGRIGELEDLAARYPAGLVAMTGIPGFGAKKARAAWEELGVETVDGLAEACRDGRLATLKGFGQKTADKVLAGIEQLQKHSGRFRIDVARGAAAPILAALRAHAAVQRVEAAGSLRRWRETAKDIDFVCATDRPADVMECFADLPSIDRMTAKGSTKASAILDSGIATDLRCVSPAEFPFALQYFTGSREHNTALRGLAREKGLKLNEYGLFPEGSEDSLGAEEEADIYRLLGLDYIEPELREDMGEIEAAAEGRLPHLVEASDIVGLLHMHTSASDGRPEVADYAEWAAANGVAWMGIADHSQAAAYAGGLSPERVRRQFEGIDEVNRRFSGRGVRILKGIESDILGDGSLDYDEDLLGEFEFIVASVHSQFNLAEEAQTRRVLAAIDNPATTVLGHMTGRLLLKRDGYAIDQREVIRACARNGVVVEINANPHRLDVDWRLIRFALDQGCLLAVCPDAHEIAGLSDSQYGLGIARKGWVERDRLANCLTADEFLELARSRRKG